MSFNQSESSISYKLSIFYSTARGAINSFARMSAEIICTTTVHGRFFNQLDSILYTLSKRFVGRVHHFVPQFECHILLCFSQTLALFVQIIEIIFQFRV